MRMDTVRGPDAGTLLVRALRTRAAAAGIVVAVRSIASRPWASATFTGTRHQVAIETHIGDAGDRWIAGLTEVEWVVRGHLVADVVIDGVSTVEDETAALISILTIEDN